MSNNPLAKHLAALLIGALLLPAVPLWVRGDPAPLHLCSPKASDHFEVTKPLFSWNSNPAVRTYEVYIDDAKAGEVPAAPIPVLHFGTPRVLPVGTHQWFIQAMLSAGGAIRSDTASFTIDPPGNWPRWAIGPFERYGENPILRPQAEAWQSVNLLSPGVLFDQGKFRMLYRAQGRAWTSRIGYAESPDGVTFTPNPTPLLDAVEPFEKSQGLEDPRFFHYGDTYYVFYTGNNQVGGIALCEAVSPDGKVWKKLGVIEPKTKNAAMICDPNGTPAKINGRFAMFIGNSKVGVCYSDDLVTWGPITDIDLKLPPGWVKPYEPCVAVTNFSPAFPEDIVLFIAGTLNGKGRWFYGISEVLFSQADLTHKVDQLGDCILKAQEPYESGQQKNSLWMNCIIRHDGQWLLYYAAGDRNVALATAPMQ